MRSLFEVVGEVTAEMFGGIAYNIKKYGIRYAAILLEISNPYVMYFLAQYLIASRGRVVFGSELLIPFVFWYMSKLLRKVAIRLNGGLKVPAPNKRFTEVDEDGMVSVDNNRVEEMLLYVADLEDWMETRGLL